MTRQRLICYHDAIERVGHWAHLVNTVLLVLSGMQIHYPSFNVFGSMNNARWVHFVDMYFFVFIGVFHVYQFFAKGKWSVAGPTPRNMQGVGRTLKYYLFLSDEPVHVRKYNPLQILTYLALFGLSIVMVAVGFALYWPSELSWLVGVFGGLMTVRQWHFIFAWVFVAFTVGHIYLVLLQPLRRTKAMVTGCYWETVGEPGAEQAE
ncbi:MAG: Ni/Fe-hydrogenase, b-type cytochrome subunit [Thermoleophilia bacterium]